MKLLYSQKIARLSVLGAAALAATAPAFAALDTAVTTAINDAKTDVLAIGALVFGVVIAIAVYKWFRRAL